MCDRPDAAAATAAAQRIYSNNKTTSYGRWDQEYSIYHAIATYIQQSAEVAWENPTGCASFSPVSTTRDFSPASSTRNGMYHSVPTPLTTPGAHHIRSVRCRLLRGLTEEEKQAAQKDKVLLPLLDPEHGDAGIFFWRLLQRAELIIFGHIQGAITTDAARKQVYVDFMRSAGAKMTEEVLDKLRLNQPTENDLFNAARKAHVEVFNGYFDRASSFPITVAMTQHLSGIFKHFGA